MANLGLFASPSDVNLSRDAAMAQMTPAQQMYMMGAKTGRTLGQGLGGLFGVDVRSEGEKDQELIRALGSKFGATSSEGLNKIATALQQAGKVDLAMKVRLEAAKMEKSEADLAATNALTAQRSREKLAADPFQKLLESGKYTPASLAAYKQSGNVADLVPVDKSTVIDPFQKLLESGKYTPASLAIYKQSKNVADLVSTEKKDGTSEFERLVDGLKLSPEQKKEMLAQRAKKLSEGDSVGLKALEAQLKILEMSQKQRQLVNLPDSAVKYEEEDLSKIDALSGISEALSKPIKYLTPDKEGRSLLELSPKKVAEYNIKNAMGNSDEQSRMYAELKQAVTHATNIKTDAARGVQTDRDVLRFANELIAANASMDTKAMLRSLQNFQKAQEKEQFKLKAKVNRRRGSYSVSPLFNEEESSKPVRVYNKATGKLE